MRHEVGRRDDGWRWDDSRVVIVVVVLDERRGIHGRVRPVVRLGGRGSGLGRQKGDLGRRVRVHGWVRRGWVRVREVVRMVIIMMMMIRRIDIMGDVFGVGVDVLGLYQWWRLVRVGWKRSVQY